MKLTYSVLLTFACVLNQLALAQSSGLLITGRVLYREGTPVKDAKVTFWSYAGGSILQPVVNTDANGKFSLTLPQPSEGAVSASKTIEGYPDAVLAFYGRSGYQSFQVIDPKPLPATRNATLVFGHQQTTIAWKLVDAETGKPIHNAHAFLQAANNPEITGSEGIAEGEDFLFVLPHNPIRITIRAAGYADRQFVEQDSLEAVHTQAFALDKKTIRLEPLPRSRDAPK